MPSIKDDIWYIGKSRWDTTAVGISGASVTRHAVAGSAES
ncbi:hypothetical protein FM103_14075 [Corynebacterium xerosis]|nr:hypothetical protein FM103_14075 [Corynebacterium xerosis]